MDNTLLFFMNGVKNISITFFDKGPEQSPRGLRTGKHVWSGNVLPQFVEKITEHLIVLPLYDMFQIFHHCRHPLELRQ